MTYGVPRQVVDPALLSELCHAGVDEGVPGARLLPRLEQLLVAVGGVGMCRLAGWVANKRLW